jgi:hypothetical protein
MSTHPNKPVVFVPVNEDEAPLTRRQRNVIRFTILTILVFLATLTCGLYGAYIGNSMLAWSGCAMAVIELVFVVVAVLAEINV